MPYRYTIEKYLCNECGELEVQRLEDEKKEGGKPIHETIQRVYYPNPPESVRVCSNCNEGFVRE